MGGWLTRAEALAYFGLGEDVEELERIVLEHDIDVDVDIDGNLTHIEAEDAKAALFHEHKRRVGYRPDDERVRTALERRGKANAAAAKRRRRDRRKRLEDRVARRRANQPNP
jgi:uncharacterized protein YuzE